MADSPEFAWNGNRGTYSADGVKAKCRLVAVGNSETRGIMTWNIDGKTGEMIFKLPYAADSVRNAADNLLEILVEKE